MSTNNLEVERQLDLTEALLILQNAGRQIPGISNDSHAQTQDVINALCDLSIHDGLTGLVNAVFFHAVLEREINRSYRTRRTCGLMVLDVDRFKRINDTYGHTTGDSVLQVLATQLKSCLRGMDTAARIGGEEFAVILPECEPPNAIHAAMRIHSALNPIVFRTGQAALQVTTSVGLIWTNLDAPVNSEMMVSQADREMYRAKRSGRGRLCYKGSGTARVSSPERSALLAVRVGKRTDP